MSNIKKKLTKKQIKAKISDKISENWDTRRLKARLRSEKNSAAAKKWKLARKTKSAESTESTPAL